LGYRECGCRLKPAREGSEGGNFGRGSPLIIGNLVAGGGIEPPTYGL
jgi:hypothetical protein